ncbi:uncharacterized protein A4U43_C08F7650 [Asparagus officinalis]|nr:uncharacterized protein A4U43_C08F7650 [Asparagus officinalis]
MPRDPRRSWRCSVNRNWICAAEGSLEASRYWKGLGGTEGRGGGWLRRAGLAPRCRPGSVRRAGRYCRWMQRCSSEISIVRFAEKKNDKEHELAAEGAELLKESALVWIAALGWNASLCHWVTSRFLLVWGPAEDDGSHM